MFASGHVMTNPIVYNKLTDSLCRFIEYEVMPWGRRVVMEDLKLGVKTVATEKFVEPYTDGRVVDFGRTV